ncbi:MAG: diaminopimelate decarboxylase, partial [Rhodobacteraceae bacterium]|nr:diaminopimelate decarboxylase [Paracoccaceae bacterium]
VVGPVCETGDTFATQRSLMKMESGELLAFMSAGAYGSVMASEYNTRPLIPEVLVKGDNFSIIRARPLVEDIIQRDIVPDWV